MAAKRWRRTISVGVPLVAALVLAAACSSNSTNSTGTAAVQRGGNLVFDQLGQAPALDPTSTFINEGIWDELQIFQTLFIPTSNGHTIIPWLATSYSLSSNKLVWTFHLRPGVQFSNGAPLTANDVKFSLEQDAKGTSWGFIEAEWKSVAAPNASTVVITTKQPWAPMLADLCLFANGVYPANYNGESRTAFFQHPIGTGPFVLSSWTKGQSLVLKRNPHYWQKGKPYLNSVTFNEIADDNTRILQLKAGSAQIDEFPPFSSITSLSATPGITVTEFPSSWSNMLYLNTKQAPFQDPKIRQAIAYAINRQAIVKAVLFGHGSPANSVLAPAVPYYSKDNPGPQYNLSKAKQLMAQSSRPKGFSTTLLVPTGTAPTTAAAVMQQNLKAIGINASIDTQDQNTAFSNWQNHDFSMFAFYWTTDIPDPDELIGGYADVGGQFTGLVNPNTTKWIAEAETSFSPAARQSLYAKIQAQIAADSSVIALYYQPYVYAYSKNVHGFDVYSTGNFHLENVWLGS